MTVDAQVLDELAAEDPAAVAPRMRDGDILLCAAHDPFSRLIGWSTRSPWSHVGIACRWRGDGRVLAFECVEKIGVRAVSMERFISETSSGVKPYPGKIVLARHAAVADRDDLEPLTRFAIDAMGDPFSQAEVLKIASRIAFGRFERRMPRPLQPRDEFICSEFVDRCLRAVGVEIPWDGLGFIAPADIAADPRLSAVARFQTR